MASSPYGTPLLPPTGAAATSAGAAAAKEAAPAANDWVKYAAIAGGVTVVGVAVAYVLFGGDEGSEGGGAKPNKDKKKKATPNASPAAKAKAKVTVQDLPDDEEDEEAMSPFDRAMAAKNKGNKYFRGGRYELAIKCYGDAIDRCPPEKATDLATFYQNRAAANEQMDNNEAVYADCCEALKLNNKYNKAMERRSKICRKMASAAEKLPEKIKLLKEAMEDITAVCILEGFQKQDHLMLVDTILKELGRAEATNAVNNREPIMTSKHFIQQYFLSFANDPVKERLAATEADSASEESGFSKALSAFNSNNYDDIIPNCTAEIESNGPDVHIARLLRATFYILSKQQQAAFDEATKIIEADDADVKVKVNALIKRASLFIQQCKDPQKDPENSLADFAKAQEIDPENADIYHHRGQVHLLLDKIDLAIEDFNKSVTINPDFPIAYVQQLYTQYRKAQTTHNLTEVNNVINLFEQAMEKFPECVETYALFAQVLSDQQKFDRAEELYRQAEKVDPDNANLLVHRGLITLQAKGDIETAVKLIKAAIEKDSKCEFAYETLGTIEVQRGNLKDAIKLFDKAIPMANTELEMAHLFGLKDAAIAQTTVSERLGLSLPNMGMF